MKVFTLRFQLGANAVVDHRRAYVPVMESAELDELLSFDPKEFDFPAAIAESPDLIQYISAEELSTPPAATIYDRMLDRVILLWEPTGWFDMSPDSARGRK